MMIDLELLQHNVINKINNKLDILLDAIPRSNSLQTATRYSCLANGKRIRAVLSECLAKDINYNNEQNISDITVIIEMIHTYSLIHDDLPCMDDDDYRRNQLSCHKYTNEATALLAGNSLFNQAILIISTNNTIELNKKNKIIQLIVLAVNDMLNGQSMDIDNKHKQLDLEELFYIYKLKTGSLMELACTSIALLANINNSEYNIISNIGRNIGILFQIKDDIKDCETNNQDNSILHQQQLLAKLTQTYKYINDNLDKLSHQTYYLRKFVQTIYSN